MGDRDKSRLKDEMEKLEQMRDELRLQAHLFKADVKDDWEDLQKKFDGLKKDTRPIQHAAEKTLDEVGEATSMLIDSVFDGFKRVRDSLK